MVVELGSYVMKYQDPSGKSQTDNGKYATVYKMVNGEWKIVVDTFNSDIPIPGM
jgi:ketosteroid isomerase-like protein